MTTYKQSNKSNNKVNDMVRAYNNIDKYFPAGILTIQYREKKTNTDNSYMTLVLEEKKILADVMASIIGFAVEYEPDIATEFRDKLDIDVPNLGEPTVKLMRNPMAGYGIRNQQSALDVIGGLMPKLVRCFTQGEDISKQMVKEFNSLMRYLYSDIKKKQLWKIKLEKLAPPKKKLIQKPTSKWEEDSNILFEPIN